MQTLSIDIETYSDIDIRSSGVYKYVQSPNFEVLMFAYRFNKEPVQIIDLTREKLPRHLLNALIDPNVKKTAYNANFERTCLSKMTGYAMSPEQWDCTMIRAGRAGWPMNLDATSKAMGLDQSKMKEGKALIKHFSVPRKPTKTNPSIRNTREIDPEKWQQFMDYCVQDVYVESGIRDRVINIPVPEFEQRLWELDQRVNDRGVEVDMVFVNNAIRMYEAYTQEIFAEAVKLTGLENPNSADQLSTWLHRQGYVMPNMQKATLNEFLEKDDLSYEVRRAVTIKLELAKTSVKKYYALQAATGTGSRIRGILQFMAANRTGRWGGRLFQPQNLPQNHFLVDDGRGIDDLALARSLVVGGDLEGLVMSYGNVPDVLSQLIRTALVAGQSNELLVADFSAIEARVIAWLAGEQWRLDVFNTHGKIYEASAAQMFGIPVEWIFKGGTHHHLRKSGKVAELALGYQGGKKALEAMGALKMGLTKKELPPLVKAWRTANPAIVALWKAIDSCAVRTLKTGLGSETHGILFDMVDGAMVITLPSGRTLHYVDAKLFPVQYVKVRTSDPETLEDYANGDTEDIYEYVNFKLKRKLNFKVNADAESTKIVEHILYKGLDGMSKQWSWQETYGGKLVENIVQAIARDCLAESLIKLESRGFTIVLHVHDEVVIQIPLGVKNAQRIVDDVMGEAISWAPGLPLKAESYKTYFYKKD